MHILNNHALQELAALTGINNADIAKNKTKGNAIGSAGAAAGAGGGHKGGKVGGAGQYDVNEVVTIIKKAIAKVNYLQYLSFGIAERDCKCVTEFHLPGHEPVEEQPQGRVLRGVHGRLPGQLRPAAHPREQGPLSFTRVSHLASFLLAVRHAMRNCLLSYGCIVQGLLTDAMSQGKALGLQSKQRGAVVLRKALDKLLADFEKVRQVVHGLEYYGLILCSLTLCGLICYLRRVADRARRRPRRR